jgi:hypothetical protein
LNKLYLVVMPCAVQSKAVLISYLRVAARDMILYIPKYKLTIHFIYTIAILLQKFDYLCMFCYIVRSRSIS